MPTRPSRCKISLARTLNFSDGLIFNFQASEMFTMSVILCILALALFYFLGFRGWSRYLAEKVFAVTANETTPAHDKNLRDDIDFLPVNAHVLWGHHYTSIAGAAPIIGPAVAVYWGWLPAMLWAVLLLIYAAIASVLPVWVLLQPRDYINAHQLIGALTLLVLLVYLVRQKRPKFAIFLPLVFVATVTTVSMVLNLLQWSRQLAGPDPTGYAVALVIGSILLLLEIWMIVEALLVLRTLSRDRMGTAGGRA